MRVLILSVLLSLVTSTCFATTTSKIGFAAYSSATLVTCNVMGMKKYPLNTVAPQVFTPDIDLARTYSLGTKSFKNYSTPKTGAFVIQFTCLQTGTYNPVSVKMFLNGIQTYFLTVDQGVFGVNP